MSAHVSNALELTGERLNLLQGKLGNLLDWQVPQLKQTVGPFDPAAFNGYDERRKKLIDACIEQLHSYSDNEIDEIVQTMKKGDEDSHGWQKFSHGEVLNFRGGPPKWFIGGFGHPDHIADFDYWTKMPHFSVVELTCLTIGINPSEFEKRDLDKLISSIDRPKVFHVLQFLLRRYEQLWRTFGSSGAYPRLFVDWAKKVEFDSHPGFIEPLRRYHLVVAPADAVTSSKKQDQREVDTIAQLFTAMAIDQLGYVPGQARSPIPKEIGELSAQMGMSITDETIRKYLRIGERFISSDWKAKEK